MQDPVSASGRVGGTSQAIPISAGSAKTTEVWRSHESRHSFDWQISSHFNRLLTSVDQYRSSTCLNSKFCFAEDSHNT